MSRAGALGAVGLEGVRGIWQVARVVDHGPGQVYRYRVSGVNRCFPPEHPDRHFEWSVPGVDSVNFDLSAAEWIRPDGG